MEYLILALATWRLTSLLYIEDGPCEVFARLRKHIGTEDELEADNELVKLFSCPDCLSVWVAALVALTYWLVDATWFWLPLALSTVSILIEKVVSYGKS